MFHRQGDAHGPLNVEIVLQDGETLRGTLVATPGRVLSELLNSSSTFVEFESFNGGRIYLAKTMLQIVRPLSVPPVPPLGARVNSFGSDPFRVLGVTDKTEREEVRQAYARLAKLYHPDKYANIDLPPEVLEYMTAMARRINAAYEAVQILRGEKPDRRKTPRPVAQPQQQQEHPLAQQPQARTA